jgi:hypothetical protein
LVVAFPQKDKNYTSDGLYSISIIHFQRVIDILVAYDGGKKGLWGNRHQSIWLRPKP